MCQVCKEHKPLLTSYRKGALRNGGFQRRCKPCDNMASKQRRLANMEFGPLTSFQRIIGQYRKRDANCNINSRYLYNLWLAQEGKCALSGIPMRWSRGVTGAVVQWNSISTDRMNPNIGYRQGNLRLVCFCFNSMRGRLSDEEMFEAASTLVKNMRKLGHGKRAS